MEKMTISVKAGKESIVKAVKILSLGGTIIYPTEDGYVLGCDSTNGVAIDEVLEISDHSGIYTAVVDSIETIRRFGRMEKLDETLVNRYMPGSLTIVLPLFKDRKVQFGFRMSSNRTAMLLAKEFKKPILAMNLRNKDGEDIYYANELNNFLGKVNLILDDGDLQQLEKTTMVSTNPHFKIHREGAVSKMNLAIFVKKLSERGDLNIEE